MLNKNMKVFIINLKESTDRRQSMIEEMKKTNLQYEFFDAVNGKDIKNIEDVYDHNYAVTKVGSPLNLGEIGCCMSHLLIYKKMIDENIGRALILEDDIIISEKIDEIIKEILEFNLQNTIVLLGQSSKKLKRKIYKTKLDVGYTLSKLFNSGYGAYGYIIDNKAAEKLYHFNYPVKYASDMWHVFWKFIDIYVLEPYLIDYKRDGYSVIDSYSKRTYDLKKTDRSIFYIFFRKSISLCKRIFWFLRDCIYRVLP